MPPLDRSWAPEDAKAAALAFRARLDAIANQLAPAEEVAGLSRAQIQGVVRQNFGAFTKCYRAGLAKDPALTGVVHIQFTLTPEGRVQGSSPSGSLPDADVQKCIAAAFEGLSFPKPSNGKPRKVVYPISFAPGT